MRIDQLVGRLHGADAGSLQGSSRYRRSTSALVAAGLALGAAVAIGWRWGGGRGQADLRRIPGQNVLLVTIDTLRADAMSSYGGPAVTPALDALARDGVRFTFAHAHARN